MKIVFGIVLFFCTFSTLAQTQLEMNEEAHKKYLQADKELNIAYKEVMKTLNESQKTLLIKAQKDWLKFRDSNCIFEASEYEGGSMQPMIHSMCLEQTTRTRTQEIKDAVNQEK